MFTLVVWGAGSDGVLQDGYQSSWEELRAMEPYAGVAIESEYAE
jgi:hypothetical protein